MFGLDPHGKAAIGRVAAPQVIDFAKDFFGSFGIVINGKGRMTHRQANTTRQKKKKILSLFESAVSHFALTILDLLNGPVQSGRNKYQNRHRWAMTWIKKSDFYRTNCWRNFLK
jgi:hypothetical protein